MVDAVDERWNELEAAWRADRLAELLAIADRLEPALGPEDHAGRGRLWLYRARAHRLAGRPEEARVAVRHAVAALRTVDHPELASALMNQAVLEEERARPLLVEAVRCADRFGVTAARHTIRLVLAGKLWMAGDLTGALGLVEEARVLPPGEDDGWYHLTRAQLLLVAAPEEADAAFARAVEVSGRDGFANYVAQGWVGRGECARRAGRLDDALRCYDEAVRAVEGREAGVRERAWALLGGASAAAMSGDPVGADRRLAATDALLAASGTPETWQIAWLTRGTIEVLKGEVAAAEAALGQIRDEVPPRHAGVVRSVGRAVCCVLTGDLERFDASFRPLVPGVEQPILEVAVMAELGAARAEERGGRWLARAARLRRLGHDQWTILRRPAEVEAARSALARLAARGAPVPLGPFLLHRPLAAGGFGQVWAATDAGGAEVAVKIATGGASSEDELRAVAALAHPGIVTLLHHGRVDGAAAAMLPGDATGAVWLATELARGGTLSDRLGRCTWGEVRRALLAVLDGLAHAHARGVLHLDIKPENVLLTDDGRVLIADLGLAGSASRPLRFAGTPSYMAPERFVEQLGPVGPWTDLYAVGCLAVALASGAPPFRATTLEAVREAHLSGRAEIDAAVPVPAGFYGWSRRLLAADPRGRFRRAADAARALVALGDADETDEVPLRMAEEACTLVLPLDDAEAWEPLQVSTDELCALPPPSAPADWRTPAPRPRPLVEAGLGLFGLRSHPVVGREVERDQLWSELRAVLSSGTPRAVWLAGPPGAGTSTLARWLAERAHEVGAAEVVHADADATDLADVVRRTWVALAERPALVTLDGEGLSAGGEAVVRELLASGRPVLVVLSCDAHRIADAAVRIDVGPLSSDAHRRMLQGLLPLAPEVLDAVHATTVGAPDFAVQLVTDLVLRDRLELGSEGWVLRAGVHGLPATQEALWRAILASATGGDSAGAAALAVLARAPGAGWAEACARAGLEVPPGLLAPLRARRLVVTRAGGPAFADPRLAALVLADADPGRGPG